VIIKRANVIIYRCVTIVMLIFWLTNVTNREPQNMKLLTSTKKLGGVSWINRNAVFEAFYYLDPKFYKPYLTLKVRSLYQKSRFFVYANSNFEDRFLTIDWSKMKSVTYHFVAKFWWIQCKRTQFPSISVLYTLRVKKSRFFFHLRKF